MGFQILRWRREKELEKYILEEKEQEIKSRCESKRMIMKGRI